MNKNNIKRRSRSEASYLKANPNGDPFKIKDNLTKAHRIIGSIDPFDVPFVALALSIENDGIWSNDKHFENLKGIKVWKTAEILKLKGIIILKTSESI